mgnify:CR=1 FL=1
MESQVTNARPEPAVIAELLYIQLYRVLRRAMVCIGDLERGSNSPWQQVQRALRLLGSIDADIIAARDLLENMASQLGYELPRRSVAIEKAKGTNHRTSPDSEPSPPAEHL